MLDWVQASSALARCPGKEAGAHHIRPTDLSMTVMMHAHTLSTLFPFSIIVKYFRKWILYVFIICQRMVCEFSVPPAHAPPCDQLSHQRATIAAAAALPTKAWSSTARIGILSNVCRRRRGGGSINSPHGRAIIVSLWPTVGSTSSCCRLLIHSISATTSILAMLCASYRPIWQRTIKCGHLMTTH